MQNVEIILEATSQGEAAVTAKNLSLSIGLNEGIITVSGTQVLKLISGREQTSQLPYTGIRMNELSQVTLQGAEKEKADARIAIWNTFINAITPALETALKADYQLNNSNQA
jgi:hypothetical protein